MIRTIKWNLAEQRRDLQRTHGVNPYLFKMLVVAVFAAMLAAVVVCFSGCMISPQQKGTVTMADRGTLSLTKKGDRLLDTGIYAKRDVPPEYAEGYVKGMSDQTKREWEDLQNAQRWLHILKGSREEVSPTRRKSLSNSTSDNFLIEKPDARRKPSVSVSP